MAAVVSGSGLGLFNSSLAQIGQAHGGQAGVGQALEGQYVNVATGNLVLQDRDESFLSAGLPISFVRTYNSLLTGNTTSEPDRWMGEYESRLVLVSGSLRGATSVVRLDRGDGGSATFRWNGTQYVTTEGSGADDLLEEVTVALPGQSTASTYWKYTEGTTRRQEYYRAPTASGNAAGTRLLHIGSEQSSQLFTLTWNGSQLTSVLNTQSHGLVFTYVGATTRIASLSIVDESGTRQQTTYGYDAQNRLVTVTTDLTPSESDDNTWNDADLAANNGHLFRTTYAYAQTGPNSVNRISSVTQSDGVVVSYEYYGSGADVPAVQRNKVKSIRVGATETLTFDYGVSLADGTTGTTVTDAASRTWGYRFAQAAGVSSGAFGRTTEQRLVAIVEPADASGRVDSTIFEYDSSNTSNNGVLTRVIKRQRVGTDNTNVETTTFTPTTSGNVGQSTVTGGSTVRRTYTAANQIETETRVNGAEEYTTRFAYDTNNRQRFIVAATGEVTEYIYGDAAPAFGQVVAVRRFTVAYQAAGASPYTEGSLTSWANGNAANASRIDYVYSPSGRLVEQIEYGRVGQTALAVNDISTKITRLIYDAHGQLLQRITVRGDRNSATNLPTTAASEFESFTYDGMNRLVSTVRRSATASDTDDAATIVTGIVYIDAGNATTLGNRIIATSDTGATRIEVRNSAGRLIAVENAAAEPGATTRRAENAYDVAGRLRMARDASGAVRYFFYNTDGTVSAEVDATGAVVRYAYDALGRVVRTERFANRVSVSGWSAGVAALPEALTVSATPSASVFAVQTSADDRASRVFYDAAGRLVGELDGEGGFTEHRYDAASRLVRTIRYATAILPANRSSSTMAGLAAAADSTNDRITRYFYDRSDRQIGVLDAEGFLTELTYDGAGRLSKTTSFASAVALANREAATLAALRPAADASKDRVIRHYYDGRNQKIAEVDAQGYLTEWVYDEAGNQRSERRYANVLSPAVTDTDTLAQVLAKRVNASDVRETRQRYNALGQLVASVDIHGTTTAYQYDEAGRLVRTTRASGTTLQQQGGERDSSVRLNSFGEAIGEISGESLQRAIAAGHIANAAALGTASESVKNTVFGSFGTTHVYDALGRKTETRDASGAVVWFFYDAASRLTHTLTGVSGNSQVEIVQTRYDAFGQIVGTTSYSARGQLGTANSRGSAQAIVDSLNAGTNPGSAVAWRDAFGATIDNASAQASAANATIEYDRAGRQTVLTQAINRVVNGATTANTVSRTTYTSFGQIQTQTIADGTSLARSTTFGYDRRGIVSGTTESGGGLTRTTAVKTDAFGNAYEWTDARGVITTASYDEFGRKLTVSKPMDDLTGAAGNGRSTTLYDAWGRVLTHTDGSNRTTTTVYDDATRTITVTTGDGVVTATQRNRHGETVKVTVPGGSRTLQGVITTAAAQLTEFHYDASGRLVRTERVGVDAGSGGAGNGYDIRGLLAWSTDADGRRTIYRYDAAGRMLESILDPRAADATEFGIIGLTGFSADATALRLRQQIVVDGQGRTVEMTDGAGIVTRYDYDRAGLQTKVTVNPNGLKLQTVIERDALGQTLYIREGNEANPNLKVTQYEYDHLGRRITEIVDPVTLKLTTRYRYDRNNNLIARVDANGNTTRYVFDADNRLRFVVDPLNGVEETRYDEAGRKAETRRYTQAAALTPGDIATIDAGGRDAPRSVLAGKLAGVPAITETYAYNGGGQLESVTDGLGHAEKYIYDLAGLRRRRIDRNGHTWQYEYDAAGRLTSETDPLNQSETYTLDGSGNRRATTTRNGGVWQRIFDSAGRLEREISPTVDVAVPQANGLSTIERRPVVTRYVYDGAGRVATRTEDFGGSLQRTFTFEYDTAGRLHREYGPPISVAALADNGTLASTSRAVVTEYQRNANGQVTGRIEDAGQPGARTLSYLYDNAGRLTRTTFPIAGAVNDAGVFFSAGGVDANGAFTATATAPYEETGYDATGRVIWVRDTRGNVRSMAYDAAGRLRFEVDALGYISEHGYDAAGNKAALTRYATRRTGVAIVDGSAPLPVTHGDDRTMTMQYDQRGLLRSQSLPAVTSYRTDGSAEATTIAPRTELRYDAQGQLRQEAVLVQSGQWAITTHFYDSLGRRTHSVDALGHLTTTQYTALGQVDRVTEHARPIAGWTTTLAGGVVSAAAPPSAPPPGDADIGIDRSVGFVYDAVGRKISEVGANGSTTNQSFDALGRAIVITVDGARQEHRYDLGDRLLATVDASRQVLDTTLAGATTFSSIRNLEVSKSPLTQYLHDAHGQIIGVRRSAAGWQEGSAIVHWVSGQAVAADDQITRFRRDAQGRVWAEERLAPPSGGGARAVIHAIYMRHDAADNLVTSHESVELSHGVPTVIRSSFGFDAVGRQVSTVVMRGASKDVGEQLTYNAFGEVTRKIYDDIAGSLDYRYDKAGRLEWTNANGGQPVSYRYTAGGGMVAEERSGVSSTIVIRMQVDELGRTLRTELPDVLGAHRQVLTYTRDRWGNVLQQDDAAPGRGGLTEVRTTTYRYNSLNQKTYERRPSVTVHDPQERTVTPEYHWGYDLAGRQIFAIDPYGTTTRTVYDTAGQVREIAEGWASVLSGGQWQHVDQPDALTTLVTHDALGRERLTEYTDVAVAPSGGAAFSQRLVNFKEYDSANAVTAIGTVNLQSNGSDARVRRTDTVYRVNAKGHRLHATGSDGVAIESAYDSQGRVVYSAERGTQRQMTYDVLGNLTGEGGDQFTYNAFGQMTGRTDRGGRVVSITYVNGMKTAETVAGSAVASRAFAYHANGLLHQVTDTVGNSVSSYGYDARGNRTEEVLVVDDGAPGSAAVRRWTRTTTTYDSHNRIDEVEHFERLASTEARLFRVTYDYDAIGNRTRVVSQTDLPGQGVVNQPPAGTLANVSVAANFTFNHTATITHRMIGMYDPDGDVLTYTAVTPADWPVTLLPDGRLQGTMPASFSRVLQVRVRDGRGGEVVRSFTLSTSNTGPGQSNTAPTVVGTNPRNGGRVFSGQSQTLSFSVPELFADANGDAFDIVPVNALPPGVTIARVEANRLDVTVVRAAVTVAENIEFMLVARESGRTPPLTSAPLTMRLVLDPPPVGNTAPNIVGANPYAIGNVETGREVILRLPISSMFADADGHLFGVIPVGGLPTGVTMAESPLGTLVLTFNRATVAVPTPLSFQVQARELFTPTPLTSPALTLNVMLQPVGYSNRAPTYNGGLQSIVGNEGATLNIPLPGGAFTDPDGDPLAYSFEVEVPEHQIVVYDEGMREWVPQTVPAYWVEASSIGLSIDSTSGAITTTSLRTLGTAFTEFRGRVLASDGRASAAGVFNISVNRRPVGDLTPVSVPLGVEFQRPLEGITDPDGDSLIYTPISELPDGLSLSTNGQLSGLLRQEVTVGLLIRITDADGAAIERTVSFRAANQGPRFVGSPVGAILMPINGTGTWTLPAGSFIDPEGQAMTYSLSAYQLVALDAEGPGYLAPVPTPSWLSIDAATGTVRTVNAGYQDTPTYFVVVATDASGATGGTDYIRVDTAYVNPPQPPPGFVLPMPVVNEGYSVQLPVFTASHPLEYSLTGFEAAPGTLGFNRDTRTLSGIGTGRWSGTVTYTARDRITGLTSSVTLNLVVNERPSVQNGIPAQQAVRGIAWPFQIPSNAYTDPDGDSVKDAFLVVWNGTQDTYPSLSSIGLGFDVATQRFTGSPNAVGTHRIGLRVDDGRGTHRFFEFSLQVAQNQFPIIPAIGMILDPLYNEDYTSAAFPAGGDEDVASLRYSMTGLPPGLDFVEGTRRITGRAQQVGTFTVTYRVRDNLDQVTTKTYTLIVNARPEPPVVPNQSITKDSPFNLTLPAFTDADGVVNPAVSGLPPGLIFTPGDLKISGSPNTAGTYVVTYTAADTRGATNWTQFAIAVSTVSNRGPNAPSPAPTLAMALVNESYNPVTLPAFADPDGDALTHTLTGLPSGMNFNQNTREISGAPTSGRWSGTLVYSASDGRGGSTSVNISFVVNDRPQRPTIPAQSLTVGTAFSLPLPAFTDVDGVNSPAVSGLPSGLSFNPDNLQITGNPQQAGTYTITYTSADGRGATNWTQFTMTVATPAPANRAPTRGPMAYDLYATAYHWFDGYIGVDTLVDPEGGAITYTRISRVVPNASGWTWLSGMPGGLYADPATGAISGTAPPEGQYVIGVEGRDAQGAYGMTTIVLNVSTGGGIEIQSAPMAMRTMSSSMAFAPEEGGMAAMAAPSDGGWATGTAPGLKTEIFSYDRRGRMLSRSGGAVTDDVSYAYGAKGQILGETSTRVERRAVTEAVEGQPAVWQSLAVTERTETVYDQRGRRLEQVVVGEDGQRRTSIRWLYHADDAAAGSAGQLAAELQYFGPTETLVVWTGAGDFDYLSRPIAGWLKSLQTMTYDNVGRLQAQTTWARPALPRPVIRTRTGENPVAPAEPIVDIIGQEDAFRDHWIDALNWIGGDAAQAEAWLSNSGGLDFAAQTSGTVAGAQARLKELSKTVYTGYTADGRLERYSVHVRGAAYGEEVTPTEAQRAYRDDYRVESWHGTSGGWVEQQVRVDRRLASGTQTDPATFTQVASAHPSTFLKVEVDAWGRQKAREQSTPVKGSRDAYQRDVVAYTGEGQVAVRRSFSKEGNNWTQGSGSAKANYRFVYVEGQALAELREKEGGARIVALSASEHAQAIRGLGVLSGMATLSRGGHRIERTAGFEAFGVAGSGGVYEAGGGSVVAQPGDTLQTLSQRVYGSSSYWYVLAEANGYSDAVESPAAGTSLRAPSISVSRNDAGTFRPYNANDAIGPNAPVMPTLPPSSDGCGKVGQLLMVVVAVIVTIYTAGAASGATGGFMATMTQGASVVAGTSGMGIAGMGYAAIGGAVGSVASQAVGLATGAIQSFSWRGVATSALTAGIGAGVGTVAQFLGAEKLLTAAASGLGSSVANASINGGFSWRQVAANVVGNAIGSAVGSAAVGALSQGATTAAGQFAAGLTSKFVGGVVSMHARRKLGSEEGVNYGNVAADAFANTLVDRWTGVHKTQAALAAQEAKREAAIAHAGSKAGRREVMEQLRIAGKNDLRARNAHTDQRPFFVRYPYAMASTDAVGIPDDGFVDQLLDPKQWGESLTPEENLSLLGSPIGGLKYRLGGVVGLLGRGADDVVSVVDGLIGMKDTAADVLTLASFGAEIAMARIFGGKAQLETDTLMAGARMQEKYKQASQLIGFIMEDPAKFGTMLAKDELAEFQSLHRMHNRAVKAGDYYEAGVHGGAAAYKVIGYVLAGYGLAKTAANVGRLTVDTFRKLSANLAELRSAGNYTPANLVDVDADLGEFDALPRYSRPSISNVELSMDLPVGTRLGEFKFPDGGIPGPAPRGQFAHAEISKMLTRMLGNQGVGSRDIVDRTAPGISGIDMSLSEIAARQLGLDHIEIKPDTISSRRTFNTQMNNWGYDPARVLVVTYDASGRVRIGFSR
jgi:YD repeat-containing protein